MAGRHLIGNEHDIGLDIECVSCAPGLQSPRRARRILCTRKADPWSRMASASRDRDTIRSSQAGYVRSDRIGGGPLEQQEHPNRIRARRVLGRSRGQERLRRAQRLRSTMDFQRVRRRGRSQAGALLALGYTRQAVPTADVSPERASWAPSRVGFSISKRVGNAVVRNLVKRRLRESVRRQVCRLAPGWDIVITARVPAGGATYDELNAEVCRLLERAKLLARETGAGDAPSGTPTRDAPAADRGSE
jgi:ribonuclease P protein component